MAAGLISYGRHLIDDADVRAVAAALRSDWLSQGPRVAEFENAFAHTHGAKYAVAVSSGTAALHLACLAAGLDRGHEALVPAYTFAATANAVLYCGARPVFADSDPRSLNIDLSSAVSKIGRRTKAFLPVHFAGLPVELERVHAELRRKKVAVIEDACHALGAKTGSGPVGNCRYSDMAVFSFHPLKSITSGEGGMITTNSARYCRKLLSLRNHGFAFDRQGRNTHRMARLGFNYRLTDIQCALGLSQLRKLPSFIGRRRTIARYYRQSLRNAPGVSVAQGACEGFVENSAHHLFVVRLADRDAVKKRLSEKGIGTQIHYRPVYLHPYYRRLGYRVGTCPNAEKAFKTALSLPIHAALSLSQARRVIGSLEQSL